MKLVTEFSVFKLKGASAQYNELLTAGKTPEEIEQQMGEAHKLEGEKAKFFVNSIKAMEGKVDGLKRVLVVTFAEEEKVPGTATKIDEHYYMLDGFAAPKAAAQAGKGGGRGGKDSRGGGGRGGKPGGPGGKGDKMDRYGGTGGTKPPKGAPKPSA